MQQMKVFLWIMGLTLCSMTMHAQFMGDPR